MLIAVRCIILLAMAFLAGCATTVPPTEDARSITTDMLLSADPIMADASSRGRTIPTDPDVLELDAEMLTFLDAHVDRTADGYQKLQQLFDAIIDERTFGLEYDAQTQTATATFENRRGNCLSFANMFVAMSRNVGLTASYQEVDIPPEWALERDTFILNRHLNVYIDLNLAGGYVVDLDVRNFRSNYPRRIVSDQRAFAHFYNNKGAERMQLGRPIEALLFLRLAIDHDTGFAPAWINLGTLYNRHNDPAYAEASYLQALQVDPKEYVAMSNLARLYSSQANDERAAFYRDEVQTHRMRNPYYRYELARQAFMERDYQEAIGNLKYAIRMAKQEDRFYFLMAQSYLQLGDKEKARQWLIKAEEVAESDVAKRTYRSKRDLLISASPDD